MAERIGIVLVHGVGEQRRFEHLASELRQLLEALSRQGHRRISVQTNASQDAELLAEHETWRADEHAPVRIDIERADGARQTLLVHEVWWADLDDKDSLLNRIRFWFWGLGLWGVKTFAVPVLDGAKTQMEAPRFPDFWRGLNGLRAVLVRTRLFAFANVFLLSALTVNVLDFVLRGLRLGRIPAGNVFYRFVGDVKLYQDRARRGQGPLTDLDAPRRVAIRRRMVRALVDAARADYDRWYILSHSLGTVVAFNGLMETAHALPNYLPHALWRELHAVPDSWLGPRRDGQSRPIDGMLPVRPTWIEDDDEVLDRARLFAKLRGLVTYGSPLDKYAFLWPQIVNVNKDKAVWRKDFEWLNVLDHSDPVAGPLSAYRDALGQPPRNLAYKASPALLLSHIKYLRVPAGRGPAPADNLAVRLIDWILDGARSFPAPGPGDRRWYRSTHAARGLAIRSWMWVLVALVLAAAIAELGVPALLASLVWLADGEHGVAPLAARYQSSGFWVRLGIVFAASAVTVTVAGIVRRLIEWRLDRR